MRTHLEGHHAHTIMHCSPCSPALALWWLSCIQGCPARRRLQRGACLRALSSTRVCHHDCISVPLFLDDPSLCALLRAGPILARLPVFFIVDLACSLYSVTATYPHKPC